MHSLSSSLSGLAAGALLLSAAAAATATAVPADAQHAARAEGSCNTPTNRACWSDGFDINTDYEIETPEGKTVEYTWEVSQHNDWTGPDGVRKDYVMLVNGEFPGPTLEANWGDTVKVTIRNNLDLNGTSFHWHGQHMRHTNIQDGVNGVTECPIAPESEKTYTFRATQYGTSWYHSHFSAQYGNGVAGAVVVHGPSSADYDIDLGPWLITDYYHDTADEIVERSIHSTPGVNPGPPKSDLVLFNGTGKNNAGDGEYARLTLTPGKSHLLRLVNPSVEHNYHVSIVGHDMTVVSTDLVPVKPLTKDSVFLGVGQRMNVIINANQQGGGGNGSSSDATTVEGGGGNFWMNVTLASPFCGASEVDHPAAIVHYEGAADELPTDTGSAPSGPACLDLTEWEPVVAREAPAEFEYTPGNRLGINITNTPLSSTAAIVQWQVNMSGIRVDWDRPVLEYVLNGTTDYPDYENLIIVDEKDAWTYWVVEDYTGIPHPMHLHGHDFLVLGKGSGRFADAEAANMASLDGGNPTRRDVTMLDGNGWLVIAFRTDNPGSWLMHCHIAWHVSGGLSVNFMERTSEQKAQISAAEEAAFNDECATWEAWARAHGIETSDSGLRRPPGSTFSGV